MKKTVWLTIMGAVLMLVYGRAPVFSEGTAIATYKGGSVTLEDLRVYSNITGTGLPEEDLSKLVRQDLENNESLIYEAVTNIAFYDLLGKKKDAKAVAGISPEALSLTSRFSLYVFAQSLWTAELAKQVTLNDQDYEMGKKLYADQIMGAAHAKVAYLFVESPEKFPKAKAMLDEWRGKADFVSNFEDYARKAREAKGTALTGGIIEDYVAGRYNPALDQKVFAIDVNKVSEPFSTQKGMFVIKVLERKPRGELPAAEVKATLTDLLTRDKLAALRKQKLEELRKKYRVTEWSGKTMPPPETVIASVDGAELRLGTFLEAYPEKGKDVKEKPESLAPIEEQFVNGELIVKDLTDRAAKSDPSVAEKLKLFQERSYALEFLRRMYERTIRVTDEEARAYYEKNKAIYHEETPKMLLALVFHVPTEEKEPSRVARDKATRQLKEMAEKFAKSTTSDTFDDDAKNLIDEVKEEGKYALTLDTLGPYVALPAGWQSAVHLEQMALRKVSPLVTTSDSFIVFQVIEEQPYKILPYEEVREKPMSVLRQQKEEEIRNKLKAEVLATGDFKIVSAESK